MSKYHINRSSGETGPCRAEKGQCPFGSEAEHYETAELARQAYEASQGGSFLMRSRSIAKRMLIVGGMAVAGVSLAGCATNIGLTDSGEPARPWTDPESSNSQVYEEAPGSGALEKANDWVNEHPVKTPSTEDMERWLDEKSEQLDGWLNENDQGVGNSPMSYEADGIYFQGRSLQATPQEVQEAQRMLESLVVQPESSGAGYNRDAQFGRGFATGMAGAVEHRDVPNATFRNDTPQARVVSGSFIDPYTGESVEVIGGQSYDADIDHIVPLKEAYVSGASSWNVETGKRFANDMDNLVYTASGVNRSKSDKDAAEWLPSYQPGQCIYVVKQIQIKGKYQLSVDSAEKAAMQQVINTKCVS